MKRFFAGLLLVVAVPSAFAQDAKTPFQKVFDVVSSPQILHKSLRKTLQDLDGLCKKSTKSKAEQKENGNVECIPEVGVEGFYINGEKPDAIDELSFIFHGDDQWSYAKGVLLKNFGPDQKISSSNLNWSPKKRKKSDPASNVNLTASITGAFYFSTGNEAEMQDE